MHRRTLLTGAAGSLAAAAVSSLARAAQDLPVGPLPNTRYPDPRIEALDPRFHKIGNAGIERIATGFRWCEGPVYVRDVASVVIGPSPQEHRVWMDSPAGKDWSRVPAVSAAFAKRSGANAVVVAEDLLSRLHSVQGRWVPQDVVVTITRNYGETANEKANELLFHLALATVSIVLRARS